MKVKNTIITLLFMGILTILLLMMIGVSTYCLKLQADKAMLLIIVVYILVGLSGGIIHELLERFHAKKTGFYPSLLQKILYGTGIGSVYMLILLVLAISTVKASIDDYVRLVTLWLMVCGSCILGKILFGGKRFS